MTFATRMAPARKHEQATIAMLNDVPGWTAGDYGQGMLSEELRDALKVTRSGLRWHPDILAIHRPTRSVCLVDAKTEMRTGTGNFSIERSSLHSLHAWTQSWGIPVVIVWGDMTANATGELLDPRSPLRVGPTSTNGGSGTPYYLWPKYCARPAQQMFTTEGLRL